MKTLPHPFLLAIALASTLALGARHATGQEEGKPGPQHQRLAAMAGTWDATIATVDSDGQPVTTKGVAVRTVGLGGFWLLEDFRGEFQGAEFLGRGQTGYDPAKGKYVGSWIDSMSPALMVMEGDFDQSGKVLTTTGTGPGMDGRPARFRNVSTLVDADTEVFEMFVTGPDGKEQKMLTITYKRRAPRAEEKGGR